MTVPQISMTPSQTGYISITSTREEELYREEIKTISEASEFISEFGVAPPRWSALKAVFMPVRTKKCCLAGDLFFPTSSNMLKPIPLPLAVPLDVLTFGSRLVSLPFRSIYNTTHPHPLVEKVKPWTSISKYKTVVINAHILTITTSTDEEEIEHAKLLYFNVSVNVALQPIPGFNLKVTTNGGVQTFEKIKDVWHMITDAKLDDNALLASDAETS